MRKFFLCLLCNGQPNEKKTFKQLMTATAFQVEKEWIDERMTKEKHFHRVFQMHFGRTTCMRLLKANLVTFDNMHNMTHSPPLWKVIWVIWFKPAESIRPRTVIISSQPKILKKLYEVKKSSYHRFFAKYSPCLKSI